MIQSQCSEITAQSALISRTVNPGDIIQSDQTLEEKSQQMAVDICGITGNRIVVPTYFVVEYPNGEKKALHHVRDAQEISDVIRQMRLYEEADQADPERQDYLFSGLRSLLSVLILLLCSAGAIAISIF